MCENKQEKSRKLKENIKKSIVSKIKWKKFPKTLANYYKSYYNLQSKCKKFTNKENRGKKS